MASGSSRRRVESQELVFLKAACMRASTALSWSIVNTRVAGARAIHGEGVGHRVLRPLAVALSCSVLGLTRTRAAGRASR